MRISSTIQEDEEHLHWQNRLERIKKYIEDNLSDDLSASVVSKKFELSVSSLLHIFKKHQQQTYGQYLENVRMDKALKLIKEGKWVQEIMDATGYKNRITFYNAFKRTFKHSPRHFQK